MSKKLTFFLSTFFILSLIACSVGSSNTEKEQADKMADFAKEKEFKEAHETPKELDFQGQGQNINFDTPDGKTGSAYALLADEPTNKYLLVIHEWWGLNDHIKQEAERLFDSLDNVTVLALDIYDGNVADNREDAGKYMQAVQQDRAEAIIKGAMAYAGEGATFGTIGWCFGGGWSLRASILAGEQSEACVIYYGMPVQKATEIAPLKADVLGIFAKNERWINPDVVAKFEALTKATGKNLKVHSFDADHAFANPSSERYNEAAAQEANGLALAFLKEKLD